MYLESVEEKAQNCQINQNLTDCPTSTIHVKAQGLLLQLSAFVAQGVIGPRENKGDMLLFMLRRVYTPYLSWVSAAIF